MVKNRKAIADGTYDVERSLAQGWRDLDEEKHADFQQRFEQMKKAWEVEKEVGVGGGGARQTVFDGESRHLEDDDVEMGEDGEEGRSPEGGGFTAVNQE